MLSRLTAPFAERLRRYLQTETNVQLRLLRAEVEAMRAELQAERHAFQQALEQQRQHHEIFIRGEFTRLQALHDGLDVERLVDTLEAAMLTVAVQREEG